MKRPTLRDVAQLAGVSHVTVSKALRADPKISAQTRERVQRIARKIGYRPDPMLSALVAYRNSTRPPDTQGVVAWIDTWAGAGQLRAGFGSYWDGAFERCRELGYRLEEFRLADLGPKEKAQRRLSRILQTRGIQGVLLPPQERGRAHLNLDWRHFSVIAFGFTLARPRLHVVTNAQFRSCVIAIRQLRARGYRRIGYVALGTFEERTDHNFTGAYCVEQLRLKESERIPPFILPDPLSADAGKKLLAWKKAYLPEVILGSGIEVPRLMQGLGLREGKDYDLALLSSGKGWKIAGMLQNEFLIGRGSIDLLVAMMHRGERGIPSTPSYTLIEGSWIDGASLRRSGKKIGIPVNP